MTTPAQSVIRRAADLLQDPTSLRWPVNELVRWLNDAQRAVILMRPDALSVTVTMSLVAGSRQSLDRAGLSPLPAKLMAVHRNRAATSTLAAVTQVERDLVDAQIPAWHALPGKVSIRHYIFDPRDPKTFYVFPPATSLAQLEIVYSAYPRDIAEPAAGATYANVAGDLSLPDLFAGDLLNLVLYRAYSKDAEYANNAALAASYLAQVTASLGMEIKATLAISPSAARNRNPSPSA